MIDYYNKNYITDNIIDYESVLLNDDGDSSGDVSIDNNNLEFNINDKKIFKNVNDNYINQLNNTSLNSFNLLDYFKNETSSPLQSSSLSYNAMPSKTNLYNNEFINDIFNSDGNIFNNGINNANNFNIKNSAGIDNFNDFNNNINNDEIQKFNIFSIAATTAANAAATATTSPYDFSQIDLINEYNNNNNTIINLSFNNTNNNNNNYSLININNMNSTNLLDSGRCPDFSDQEFARFEFWICGVILNFVGLLGILGNILSMIILSRPQMRSSINYLLIGLARCDTVLIITSILLFGIPSIYPYTGYLFYYYYYIYPNISPCMFPLAMAAQTSSVYMTFTVTLERYVAVCHPLKARALCTYGRAKIYFIICILFAFLYNIPRFWEVIVITDTLNYNNNNIPIYNNPLNPNSTNSGHTSVNSAASSGTTNNNNSGGGGARNSTSINSNSLGINTNRIDSLNSNSLSNSASTISTINFNNDGIGELFLNNNYNYDNINDNDNDNNVIFCVIASSLRRNDQYINIYIHWCYLIFIYFIPFLSLAILNCLIYRQVQKANRERQRLSRTERREIGLATMLLCVVIVFFLLNFLALYTNILEAFYDIIDDYLIKISNLLVTINSSANFIIYVIFGEKFKRIFLLLFCKGRMSRDQPDLIHYESSISNGEGNNRSSGRFSRHGTQRSTAALTLNRNNNNLNNNNNNNSNNNNGIPTSVRITSTKRIKRNRAPSPGPCVYYPARDVQRTQTVITPSSSLHFDCYNKNGGMMTSGF